MRTSRICLILLPMLVVQISSEITELDKVLNKIKSSAVETAAAPFQDILDEIRTNPDINNFLKEYIHKVKRVMEDTQEGLFNLLPKEEREKREKILGYLSLYASSALSRAAKGVTHVTNTSFDTLPDDIKTKLLDLGNDINDSLRKIKVTIENNSKTSQKNPK
ncbi:uncharacterized protein LOC113551802 [Rhopalosiphum maidis]|uniref:uncharacterized protein LOC113551802 n=1 Tax=Rhopalosiphum maidis TaxID=43146 RepID=UPI000EFE076C|nr:uncharacterized protein LOC113551802 [Rhopalosiphum maidis]